MSISKTVETWADVRFERTMCSAVRRRMGDIGTTSTRAPAPGAAGAAGATTGGAGGGVAAAGGAGAEAAAEETAQASA